MELKLPSNIGTHKRAGVCTPLWSILSRKSFECGDLYSLEAILPWLRKTGFTILQILPLNDCGLGSSPYSSLSSFAIDPLYISLFKLGISRFNRKNSIPHRFINKQRIVELKLRILQEYYKKNESEYLEDLNIFIQDNNWLKPYLVFKFFYEKHYGLHWKDWQNLEKISGYSEELYQSLIEDKEVEAKIKFIAWLQFIAFQQLSEIKQIYTKNKILLKGDMPILTSSNSADVWAQPHLYKLDLQAGAPPDNFSAVGQNWGFPVLDWDKMLDMDMKPWKQRLAYQENFFHMYRVDHVIGMYRIWAIPLKAPSARYGYFYPQKGVSAKEFQKEGIDISIAEERRLISIMDRDRYFFHWDFHLEEGFREYSHEERESLYKLSFQNLATDEAHWKSNGEKVLLSFQKATGMFPCAEDLGSVPGFVRDSLHENEIFGIDITRWTRSFEDGSYISPESYRKSAISSLSTHDTSLALDWWFHELNSDEKEYAASFFIREKDAGKNQSTNKNDPSFILENLLHFAFSTNSHFSIQMLQDVLFTGKFAILENWNDHKINVPGTAEEKNWRYRFGFFLEDLEEEKELNDAINQLLTHTKRIPTD